MSENEITPASLKRWGEVLGRTALKHLDLAFNNIEDEGVKHIVKGLQQVLPLLPKDTQPSEMDKNPKLEYLGLKGVSMKDDGGLALSQLMLANTRITKVNVDSNIVHHRFIDEIASACNRNRLIQKKSALPKYQQELGELIEITKDEGGLL